MKHKLLAAAMVAATWAAGTTAAEKFAYRGQLERADGATFTTALPMNMTFRLYSDETGGSPLWGRTVPVRVEADGSFYTELSDATGSASDRNLPYAEIANALATGDGSFWIGLAPGEYTELSPRQKLASVPSALCAVSADKIVDLKADALTAATIDAASATVADLTITNQIVRSNGNICLNADRNTIIESASQIKLTGALSATNGTIQPSGFYSKSDALMMFFGGNNIQGNAWSTIFVPASDSVQKIAINGVSEMTAFSLGGRE